MTTAEKRNGAALSYQRGKRYQAEKNGHEEPKPRAKFEIITPAEAKLMQQRCEQILKEHPERNGNRRYDEEYALSLAQSLENDEWEENGETVKVATDGFTEDGQHRIGAIVLANKPMKTLVARDLAPGCFDTVDCGKKRTGGDVLSRHGENNCNRTAAALNYLWRYESGSLRKTGRSTRIRPSQLMEYLTKHPGMRESAVVARGASRLAPAAVVACAHYLFSRKHGSEADRFIQDFARGEELKRGDPVFVLRDALIDSKRPGRTMQPLTVFALMVKAWNARRGGATVKTLRWNGYSETPEPFPKVV